MANKYRTPAPSAQGRQKSAVSKLTSHDNRYMRYKVVLIGDTDTGKTSVMLRLSHRNFTSVYVPTVGIDFSVRTVSLDEIRYKLTVWDTSGQERFKLITLSYYRGAQGIIIFYDASRQSTFDNVPNWIEDAKKYSDATLMLVGTKCDSEEKVVAYETAKDFADENDMLFFEVSAKDGTNIEFVLLALLAEVRQKQN